MEVHFVECAQVGSIIHIGNITNGYYTVCQHGIEGFMTCCLLLLIGKAKATFHYLL